MEEKLKIKIILGSTRTGRFGEKPANWLYGELKKKDGIDVELLDLRDYPMPFFNEPDSTWYSDGDYTDPTVQKWAKKISEGDAFIIVTPEYNHGPPGVLKNALDSISGEWAAKPVGFVSYGSTLGARAIEQLRMVAIELQMAPIRHAIHIPSDIVFKVKKSPSQDYFTDFEPLRTGPMGDKVALFVDQLIWWAKALKTARESN